MTGAYPDPPGDGVLTDAQRAAFGMPSRHQVVLCSTCLSGTRLVQTGEVVHEPGCTAQSTTATGGADGMTTAASQEVAGSATTVLSMLGSDPLAVKELMELTNLSETTVRKALKDLESEGKARKDGSGWARVTADAKPKPERKPRKSQAARTPDARLTQAREADEKVLDAITKAMPEGLTRRELGDVTGLGDRRAYGAIWRLSHKTKQIDKGETKAREPRWVLTS